MKYSVTVGNIGCVYSGDSKKEALSNYREYVSQSKEGYGRAASEDVTLFCDEDPIKVFSPRKKTPTVAEIASLLVALKREIADDYRCTDDPEDNKPGMLVTIGCNNAGKWGYQTGDNSFTGGAYGFPHWALVYLYHDSNCRELAREAIGELKDAQVW